MWCSFTTSCFAVGYESDVYARETTEYARKLKGHYVASGIQWQLELPGPR